LDRFYSQFFLLYSRLWESVFRFINMHVQVFLGVFEFYRQLAQLVLHIQSRLRLSHEDSSLNDGKIN